MLNPLLVEVPVCIETRRLLLRAPRAGDGPALHEALVESLPELRRFLWFLSWVAEEQTLDSAEIRCRRAQANFFARTDLPFWVIDKATGKLVGSAGLHRTDWSIPKTEVGYWIRTSCRGNGYVAEAVDALVKLALEQLGARRIELITDEENTSSRKVAERCQFELEGVLRNERLGPEGRLRNTCIYARLPAAAAQETVESLRRP